jgi:hypothetical protein
MNLTPDWARKAEDGRRPLRRPILPFDTLDAPWKALEAAQAGVIAGVFMVLTNLLAALGYGSGYDTGRWSLVQHLGLSLTIANLIAAGIVGLLALHLHRTRSAVTAWIILIWSIADLLQVSFMIYGHAGMRMLTAALVFFTLLGVRGAMRLRRFEREPDPAQTV